MLGSRFQFGSSIRAFESFNFGFWTSNLGFGSGSWFMFLGFFIWVYKLRARMTNFGVIFVPICKLSDASGNSQVYYESTKFERVYSESIRKQVCKLLHLWIVTKLLNSYEFTSQLSGLITLLKSIIDFGSTCPKNSKIFSKPCIDLPKHVTDVDSS